MVKRNKKIGWLNWWPDLACSAWPWADRWRPRSRSLPSAGRRYRTPPASARSAGEPIENDGLKENMLKTSQRCCHHVFFNNPFNAVCSNGIPGRSVKKHLDRASFCNKKRPPHLSTATPLVFLSTSPVTGHLYRSSFEIRLIFLPLESPPSSSPSSSNVNFTGIRSLI